MKDKVIIDLQISNDVDSKADFPSVNDFESWINLTLTEFETINSCELTIRIVDDAEIQCLNKTYRNQDKPTNILSFPSELTEFERNILLEQELPEFLGDLVIDFEQLQREASEQHKAIKDHWSHLTVHGVLHLLGFDHIDDQDAIEMEEKEIFILKKLSIDNPYL